MNEQKQGHSVMQNVGDWLVVMEWPEGVDDGGPARLTIEPIGKMPVGGLSSTVLRHIDFRTGIEKFREQVAASQRRGSEAEATAGAIKEYEREQLRSALSKGVTMDYLAMLSWHYVRAAERGQANINDYLADMIDKPVGTLRGHLRLARSKSLLSGSPGRKGGELSSEADALVEPYAQAWLAEFDKLTARPRSET